MLPPIQALTTSGLTGTFTSTAAPQHSAASFGAVLDEKFQQGLQDIRAGEAGALKGVTGDMPIHQAVADVMQAERTLQLGLSLRDKCVGAFLELSRMQI